jgi:hypothetical protein
LALSFTSSSFQYYVYILYITVIPCHIYFALDSCCLNMLPEISHRTSNTSQSSVCWLVRCTFLCSRCWAIRYFDVL